MLKGRISILKVSVFAAALAFVTSTAVAQIPRPMQSASSDSAITSSEHKEHKCTLKSISGKWVVITDVLHAADGSVQGATVGTLNMPGDGTLGGVYDREGVDGFHPGIAYAGTVTVNPDCTGTMTWADTSLGVTLKASINVGDDSQEINGMFQVPDLILGTFRARRTDVHHCSMKTIASSYTSTSGLLYQISGMIDGYALGTIKIHGDGSTSQSFALETPGGFEPGLTATGTVTVRPDCTGTASFVVTGDTTPIGQSFAVADGGREIWSMFQDPTIEIGTSRGVRIRDDHDHH